MSAPVSSISVEADSAAHRLTLSFSFDVPSRLVWAAMTEPSSVSRWLTPVSSDPESGRRHLLLSLIHI